MLSLKCLAHGPDGDWVARDRHAPARLAAPRTLKKKEARVADLLECCSPGMTRTCDPMINSHLLCQLSYWE